MVNRQRKKGQTMTYKTNGDDLDIIFPSFM